MWVPFKRIRDMCEVTKEQLKTDMYWLLERKMISLLTVKTLTKNTLCEDNRLSKTRQILVSMVNTGNTHYSFKMHTKNNTLETQYMKTIGRSYKPRLNILKPC